MEDAPMPHWQDDDDDDDDDVTDSQLITAVQCYEGM